MDQGYTNPAAEFLKVPRRGTADDIIRSYACHLLAETNCRTLPVSLNAICKYLNLPIRRTALSDQHGLTTEDLRIYLNADDRETVQKFSLAHEVMEVLFFAIEAGVADEWLSDDVLIELTERKEKLCELGAAELVMPPHLFCDLVLQRPVDLAWACEVAARCQVSLTATVWRIIELNLARLVLIVWQRKHKPTEYVPSQVGQLNFFGSPEFMDPEKRMRVERVFVPPTFSSFIPTNKSIPSTSLIDRAFASGVTVRGMDDFAVGALRGQYYVEAMPVHVDDERRVMSLIHLDGRPR